MDYKNGSTNPVPFTPLSDNFGIAPSGNVFGIKIRLLTILTNVLSASLNLSFLSSAMFRVERRGLAEPRDAHPPHRQTGPPRRRAQPLVRAGAAPCVARECI